jgi:hypothetical protein
MEWLRWVVAAFIVLNAISGGLLALRAARLKRRERLEPDMPAVNALLASIPAPLVYIWLTSMVLFVGSAVLLVLAEPAAIAAFILALTLNLLVVWKAHEAIYGNGTSNGSSGQILTRCVLFGMLCLAGHGAWAASREQLSVLAAVKGVKGSSHSAATSVNGDSA